MGLPRLLWIRLKAALACVWALVGRLFCCFRRRRKHSGPGLPTSIEVQSVPRDGQTEAAPSWEWEEPPAVVTVQDKIRAYRETRSRVSESEQPEEPDFFAGMTPSIRRAQQLLVASGGQPEPATAGVSSRLAYSASAAAPQAVELTDLEEPSAWEADDDIDPDALQSHQRALRQQQLQRKREQRSALSAPLR